MSTNTPTKPSNGSTTRKPSMKPIGSSGTLNFHGFINTEDMNRDWTGQQLYRTADYMFRSDPVVRAALLMVVLPICEASWTIVPASSDDEDQEVAEFVRRALLEHIDWPKVVWDCLYALRYGHAVLEETYEAVEWDLNFLNGDGDETDVPTRLFWVPAAYQPRLGRTLWRWIVNPLGYLTEVVQRRLDPVTAEFKEVGIPVEQLLVFVNEQEGDNYLGSSLLRSMYRPWYTKEKLEVIDAIAKERAAAGVPVGTVPNSRWDADSQKMEQVLSGLRANEEAHVVLRGGDSQQEPGEHVEMLDMKAASQADCVPSLHYHVVQILWSVLGAWQALGQTEVGARATAEAQDDPFYMGVTSIASRLAAAVNRQVVPRLVAYNYKTDKVPTFIVEDVTNLNLNLLAQGLMNLASASLITPDPVLEAHLRKVFRLPDRILSEEDPPPEAPDPNAPPPAPDDSQPPDPSAPNPDDPTKPPPAKQKDNVPDKTAVNAARRLLGRARAALHQEPDQSYWRPLTELERHVSLAQITATVEEQRQRYQTLTSDEGEQLVTWYASHSLNLDPDHDMPDPVDMQDRLQSQIEDILRHLAEYGRHTIRNELHSQKRTLAKEPKGSNVKLDKWVKKRAKTSAKAVVTRMHSTAEGLAARSAPPSETVARTMLASVVRTSLRQEAVNTVGQAFSAGRQAETQAVAEEGLADRAVYSSVLDKGTCDPCLSLDGQEYDITSDEFDSDYPPLADCEGGDACRCLMVIIAGEEA